MAILGRIVKTYLAIPFILLMLTTQAGREIIETMVYAEEVAERKRN